MTRANFNLQINAERSQILLEPRMLFCTRSKQSGTYPSDFRAADPGRGGSLPQALEPAFRTGPAGPWPTASFSTSRRVPGERSSNHGQRRECSGRSVESGGGGRCFVDGAAAPELGTAWISTWNGYLAPEQRGCPSSVRCGGVLARDASEGLAAL